MLAFSISMALFPLTHASAHALAHSVATGNGRISGQLLNGSQKNIPIASKAVTLQVAQDGSARDLATVTTDAHGAYSFPKLATDSFLSYALYIRYEGAQYVSALVTLDSKPTQQINLTVYEATTSTANIAIVQSTVLVHAPDSKSSAFTVSELFSFENLSLQTYVGSLDASQGKPNALLFSLPKDARNAKLVTGFTGYSPIQITGGFAVNAAVPPGSSSFAFSFEVPYTSSVYDFSYDAMYPTVNLAFMVAPSIHASSGSLNSQGLITADQHAYNLFKGSRILANQEVHVSFEGLPSPTSSSSPLDLKVVWLILCLLFLLAIVVVSSLAYRLQDGKKSAKGRKPTGRNEQKKAANTPGDRKEALLHELLELDKTFEAGKISKTTYHERRARIKARLRTLMSEQEAVKR